MNLSFLFWILNGIMCRILFKLSNVGLLESEMIVGRQSDFIATDYKLTYLSLKLGINQIVDVSMKYFGQVNAFKKIYGVIDYDLVRNNFYTNGKRNRRLCELKAGYSCTRGLNVGKNEFCKFSYELSGETNKSIALVTQGVDFFSHKIGTFVKNVYEQALDKIDIDELQRFKDKNITQKFNLRYFDSYESLLKSLKILVVGHDIVGDNYEKSALKFITYYE